MLKFIFFFGLRICFCSENLPSHLYHIYLGGKISYVKCEVSPATYDTFADSDKVTFPLVL